MSGRGRGRGRGGDGKNGPWDGRQRHAQGIGRAGRGGRTHDISDIGGTGWNRNAPFGRGKSVNADVETSGERKFADACKEIQASVERYIATHQYDESSEEEEEEDIHNKEESVLGQVLSGYSGEGNDLGRTHQYLQDAFKSGALVCLICIENVKRSDAIWSCSSCFSCFHISCAQKWAKDSLYYQSESLADSNEPVDKKSLSWCCPKCRESYSPSLIPSKYFCFCGKTVDPKVDPWLIPHSCGEKCGRKLQPECGHTCLLLCHPGPCPPCPVTIRNTCYCEKSTPQIRRCCSKTWSCNKPCGRELNCHQHTCQNPCHDGPCKPCPKKSLQKCHCRAEEEFRDCATPNWQCDKICGKKYRCGHHVCKTLCHEGSCGDCPDTGMRQCPCGKTNHMLPCTQEVPTCGDTCGKSLICGQHKCVERCHKGACPTCLHFSIKKCRCGLHEKEMACSKEFTCETKCKKMRDCRKHACNKKCCQGDCPPCEQPCGRTLGCKNHKCESRCHQGPCYPCPEVFTLYCYCKRTSITVPCGREKITKPPRCNKQCRIPPDCHHPEREFHRCHQGPCPTCKIVCSNPLECGHVCPAPCHDAVAVKIHDTRRRAGPWEKVVGPQVQIQKKPCPPCLVPVLTICFGKHEKVNWPCSDIRPYSCGRKCGRKLACSNHECSRDCHVVEDANDEIQAGSNCATCEENCSKPRPEGCNHQCPKPCHPGECPPCAHMIRIRCHCELNQLYVKCNMWNGSSQEEKDDAQSCKNQCNKMISCGHRCQFNCHVGSCSLEKDCRKRVAVRCPCKRQRKDFVCSAVTSGSAVMECNEACIAKMEELKKVQEEENRKKKEEEEAKQRRELEEFEKKMEGKKNRRRERKKPDVETRGHKFDFYKLGIISLIVLLVSGLFYVVLTD